MAERKTGVIPLDLITDKDRSRYTDGELVEYVLKTLQFLKDGEEPTFSGRGLQEKFEAKEPFLKENMEKFDRKLQNLKQFRPNTDSEPNGSRTDTESAPNGTVRNEICDMSNEITKKKSKPKEKISFAKDLIENYSQNFRLVEALYDYVDMRKKIRSPLTEKALKLNLTKLSQITLDEEEAIEIVNQSIEHGWKAFYPLKTEEHKKKTRQEELRELYEKYKREEEQNDTRRDDSMPQYTFPDIPLLEDGEW